MGKPSFSPRQQKRRKKWHIKMKDFFARRDVKKCERQQHKERDYE